MYIFGAGLSGLLAAHVFPTASIHEAQSEAQLTVNFHSALLRFRSDAIGRLTGINFKPVLVHKGIFCEGTYTSASIAFSNMYSAKVIGRVLPRSIWDLEPVERYIAPDDFQAQMLDAVRHRVSFGSRFHEGFIIEASPIISTMPMFSLIDALSIDDKMRAIKFKREDIKTFRVKLDGVNVHQTIYFPGPETNTYRASITGDTLIVETVSTGPFVETWEEAYGYVMHAFGIDVARGDSEAARVGVRSAGKIAPIDDVLRRKFIYECTRDHRIYAAGRYAIWKNVIMDDVLDDLFLIKRMVVDSDHYSAMKGATTM